MTSHTPSLIERLEPVTTGDEGRIARAADEIFDIVRDLPGPKQAALALIAAHVRMTLAAGLPLDDVPGMLAEYSAKFTEHHLESLIENLSESDNWKDRHGPEIIEARAALSSAKGSAQP